MNHNNNHWVNIVENEIAYDKNIKLFVNSQSIQHKVCQNIESEKFSKKNYTQDDINHCPEIQDMRLDIIKTLNDPDIVILEKTSLFAKKIKHLLNKISNHQPIITSDRSNKSDQQSIDWLIDSLELLRDVMVGLSDKHMQPIGATAKDKPTQDKPTQDKPTQDKPTQEKTSQNKISITRNSYKFCEYGYECRFNYEMKQKCHVHHFVFNLVYLDIMDILGYISKISSTENPLDIEEIKTSINTITYVLNHMHDELLQLKKMRPMCYQNYIDGKYNFNSTLHKKSNTQSNTQTNTQTNIQKNNILTKGMVHKQKK
jgi:hypothetical protein